MSPVYDGFREGILMRLRLAATLLALALEVAAAGARGEWPFQWVAAGEKRPERWVRNLVAIRVLTAG
jgi:hypothetical protein